MNKKISELSSAGSLTGTEVLPIVQSSNTVKTTVQAVANLFAPATQSLQMVTTQGNTTTNAIIVNSPTINTAFEGLQVFDADVNTHKITPTGFILDGEEADTTMTYEYPITNQSLTIPAQTGILAVYQTTRGFVLPTTIPSNPLTGSIYFDSGSAQLKVWNGSWVSIS